MENGRGRLKNRIFFSVAMMAASVALFAPHAANAGPDENITGNAWSGSIGWISMNSCSSTGVCGPVSYGVTFADVPGHMGWANLTGFGWSETLGWVCFGMDCTGDTPEGGPSYAQFRDEDGGRINEIYGWAKIVSMGDAGWISLNCANRNECAASNYRTVFNPLTGEFTFGMFSDHWAWGGTSEVEGAGWVDFSRVRSDWTVSRLGYILRPEGVYEPDAAGLRGTHLTTMTIGFEGFSAARNNLLECDLSMSDGTSFVLSKVIPATVYEGHETLEYAVRSSDSIIKNTLWTLDGCRIGGARSATACATDADCNVFQFCDEAGGTCRLKLREKIRKWPIFTHSNQWSGLDDGQDQYTALRCHSGFHGNYFNNDAQCDFAGDASFSLLMRRGVPLEGDCHDGIDNDGNGETDCADRYCRGISYRCQTLPRTACVWGQPDDGIMDCTDTGYINGMLCCSRQPQSAFVPDKHNIVNGLECSYGDPNDGYFDCDCTSEKFGISPTDDCYYPGHIAGDLCCNEDGDVVK